MHKGTLLCTSLLVVVICKAFPRYSNVNHQERIQRIQYVPVPSPTQEPQNLTEPHTVLNQVPPSVSSHHEGNNLALLSSNEVQQQCGSDSFECVPLFQCVNGYINTNGSGYFNRFLSQETCSHPNFPNLPTVCCRIPGSAEPRHLPVFNQCGVNLSKAQTATGQMIQSNVSYNESQFGEFPWQAIIFFSNFTFRCGASIIGDKWLLTAAQCVDGFNAEVFTVRVGEWQINTFSEQVSYADVSVAAITIHHNYNAINFHNNIAVIELAEALSPQENINSICLPAPGQTLWIQHCINTGWGKDSFTGQYQTIMRKLEVPLVDPHQCQKLLQKTELGPYFNLDNSFICAGGGENGDTCKEVGGNPLSCQDPITDRYILTGISAWGISCGENNVPGSYVNVQEFVPWIEAVISGTYLTRFRNTNMHATENKLIAFPSK